MCSMRRAIFVDLWWMAGALSMLNTHSEDILLQQLKTHLRDIQMHFLCKKKKMMTDTWVRDFICSSCLPSSLVASALQGASGLKFHKALQLILNRNYKKVREYVGSSLKRLIGAKKGCFYCVSLLINWRIVTYMVPNDRKSDLTRRHPSFIYVSNNKSIFAQVHMPNVLKWWCILPQSCWK